MRSQREPYVCLVSVVPCDDSCWCGGGLVTHPGIEIYLRDDGSAQEQGARLELGASFKNVAGHIVAAP